MSLSQDHHSLKRDHGSFDFESLVDLEKPFTVPTDLSQTYASQPQELEIDSGESSIPTPPVSIGANKMDASPVRSRSASLTDAASATPSRGNSPMPTSQLMFSGQQGASPSPSAFVALNGSAPPPSKKPKISFVEKEAKRIEKEIKDQGLAEEKARKIRERQAQAEDKAKRDNEKDAERRKTQAERERKRAAVEAEKAAKEEKRRRKEEEKLEKQRVEEEKRCRKEEERLEKQRVEEEKRRRKEEERLEKQRVEEEKKKKDGKQKPLTSFFQTSAAAKPNALVDRRSESPVPNTEFLTAVPSPAALTPKKLEKTTYEKAFGEFFIKEFVTMPPINRFERDEQASNLLHSTIDSYILGDRSPDRRRDFCAIDLFHLPSHDILPRGKRYMPVREIMAEMSGKSTRPIDLTTDSQSTQIKRTTELLRKVPLKFLRFQEDVRPPYRGTYTVRPVNGVAKLARNPLRRDLPNTNYDYDSEAEWVEDEDAEDLNSEGDEDEDMGEEGEDMEGFLDDENDELVNSKRLVLQGDLEPISTGLCWEDYRRRSTNVKMMPYRMEIILDQPMKSIDPFSSQYWDPAPSYATMHPPRQPLNTLKANSLIVNGSSNSTKSVKPFFTPPSALSNLTPKQASQSQLSTHLMPIPPHSTAISSSSHATASNSAANVKLKKLMPAEDIDDFMREIKGSNLTKVGLIEVLKKKFPGRTAAAVKNTLELIAQRVGNKEADRRWVIIDESGVA
ncbi:Chromatin assembly factor 1 subunit rlf2 [Hyphodiscus hymeniophilus]|uniref:Chromatin assembly factor 1 subunit rlf2 n=1 Tax=Hyphodiscus hymeniophilus TaxID=353542 RepID=A0A9P6VF36_9HELO|nr:Chromatin assembly factor 1 subunit rlf2 [Hyphodiscus hymeniophilus]